MEIEKGVSEELYSVIVQLMKADCLKDFNLGGGTNLAIRYNHRESTDIDLFSEGIVGTEKLKEISTFIKKEFKEEFKHIYEENFGDEKMAFLRGIIERNNVLIKIDIIQNMPLLHDVDVIDEIRLINEIDIGSLKLVSAADRGTQKDFCDLLLLTQIHNLNILHENLIEREKKFSGNAYGTIFNPEALPSGLANNLTPLGDFNKASDRSMESNRLKITKYTKLPTSWPVLSEKWVKEVETFAKLKGLSFDPTPKKRSRKSKGFKL